MACKALGVPKDRWFPEKVIFVRGWMTSVSSSAEVLGDQGFSGEIMGIFFIFLKEFRVEMRSI
ncbi:MAG: hypothetical protein CMO74_05635 [Verrucomicrobiales bacterium]|nr:hypothetical protein [Verrucomicrobiales bacterium]